MSISLCEVVHAIERAECEVPRRTTRTNTSRFADWCTILDEAMAGAREMMPLNSLDSIVRLLHAKKGFRLVHR